MKLYSHSDNDHRPLAVAEFDCLEEAQAWYLGRHPGAADRLEQIDLDPEPKHVAKQAATLLDPDSEIASIALHNLLYSTSVLAEDVLDALGCVEGTLAEPGESDPVKARIAAERLRRWALALGALVRR